LSDQPLAGTDREEQLSLAYVHAVAAAACYVVAARNLDRDGIDIQIQAGGDMRPCLDIQIKATVNLGPAQNGVFRYPLKKRNYDLLLLEVMVPRILVVLELPKNEREWVNVTSEQLILRRCAWWTSLVGQPETKNKESVTVSIQNDRRFDVDGLQTLMERARTGSVG
jgi:hypothetical protein